MPEVAADQPLGFAVAGLHGFARTVTDLALTESGCRVVSVGDPAAADPASTDRVAELRAAGVAVHDGYEEALAEPGVEAVWLPVPIGLHRPFAEAAFAAGKAVLCEKPLAGCLEDAEALVSAARNSGLAAAVGFHDLFDPAILAFKREMHGGRGIGELESVTVLASWPRDDAYFGRNAWAGRLRHGGVWVRDSPANNALAHYLMLGLFLAGDDDLAAASPEAAEAVTLRAADIENYDTVSALLSLGAGCVRPGARLGAHLSHAADEEFQPQVLVRGSRGSRLWKLRAADPDLAPADRVLASPRAGHGPRADPPALRRPLPRRRAARPPLRHLRRRRCPRPCRGADRRRRRAARGARRPRGWSGPRPTACSGWCRVCCRG